MADTATDTTIETPETESTNCTVKVEDTGPSRKKLFISVPAETVDNTMKSSLDTIAVEASVPGFRKGRAPKRLVERKFGSFVAKEAKNQLIGQAYREAIEKESLKVIGEPMGGNIEELEAKTGEPLDFEVEVEVQPEFDLPSLEGIEVLKPEIPVEDEQIDKQIEDLRINEGSLEERDTPEPGDYLTGVGVMTDADGEEYYNIDGAVVRIPTKDDDGKGMVLGVMVDDFEKQLGLPKADETATIKVTGPENHEREDLRGKDLTVSFKVTTISRIIPAAVEDIVTSSGLQNEGELREAVRMRIEQQAGQRQQTVMRQQVAKHLAENVEMELPERIADFQAERLLQRRRMELLYRGVDEASIERHIAELRGGSAKEMALRELKLFFILFKAAEELEVGVTEAEVNGQISRIAIQRGERPDELRQRLIQSGQVTSIVTQIREHKVMDAILGKANVEDVSADEFKKRLGQSADEAHDDTES